MAKKKDYKTYIKQCYRRGREIIAKRDSGDTWVDIGIHYGITKQCAQQIYKRFKSKDVDK